MLAAAVSKPDALCGRVAGRLCAAGAGRARRRPTRLRDFARRTFPERAAAPKEIVILEQHAAHRRAEAGQDHLRRDAACRAFRDLLANLADGKLAVEMVADPVKGSVVEISIIGAQDTRDELEKRIQELMQVFPISYRVRWLE